MKVLFISVNNEKDPYPVAPIGAAYVAKALHNNHHDVRILDLCFVEDDYPVIAASLKDFAPDIIGVSIRNIDNLTYKRSMFYMPRIRRITDFIKSKTSAPIVVGGSGFSIFPEEVLKYLEVEVGIIGEGETAFAQFVDAINNDTPFHTIQNLCYIRDGKFNANNMVFTQIHDYPERSLLNNSSYLEFGGMGNIQSKRGCPFKCNYCTYPHIEGNTLRLREPVDVVEELKEMRSLYGIDYVFFVDDIFNFPEDHAAVLCEEIIRNDLAIDWTCFATPKGMTRQLAELMKMSGCKGVEFGSDAGSEKTLKGLGKHFTPDDIAHAAECCNVIDLPNAHYIIIAGPEEDRSALAESILLFEKIEPTAVIALLGLRIYPNTQLHQRAVREGIIEKDRNLLEPVFYISPALEYEELLQYVSDYARGQQNWIVPGLNIRCDSNMMALLRKMGNKGPLWNMIS
jgi:radical SAM superfamily enzyme YgiQ (UPF0313 family)